jgi:hypothetical protein
MIIRRKDLPSVGMIDARELYHWLRDAFQRLPVKDAMRLTNQIISHVDPDPEIRALGMLLRRCEA